MNSPTPLDASRPPLHRSLVYAGSTLLQRQGEREVQRHPTTGSLAESTVCTAAEVETGHGRIGVGAGDGSLPGNDLQLIALGVVKYQPGDRRLGISVGLHICAQVHQALVGSIDRRRLEHDVQPALLEGSLRLVRSG